MKLFKTLVAGTLLTAVSQIYAATENVYVPAPSSDGAVDATVSGTVAVTAASGATFDLSYDIVPESGDYIGQAANRWGVNDNSFSNTEKATVNNLRVTNFQANGSGFTGIKDLTIIGVVTHGTSKSDDKGYFTVDIDGSPTQYTFVSSSPDWIVTHPGTAVFRADFLTMTPDPNNDGDNDPTTNPRPIPSVVIGSTGTGAWRVQEIQIQFTEDSTSSGDLELVDTGDLDAVVLPDGGTTDNLTYATFADIPLPAKLKVNTVDAIDVTWTNDDSYPAVAGPVTAGTYTFTGTIPTPATLEAGFTDTDDSMDGLTVTTTITVAEPQEISGYDAVAAPFAGSIQHPVFTDEAAVAAALGTLTAIEDDVTVGASWSSFPSFDPAVAGTYKFTATPNSFPAGYVDNDPNSQGVEVDVVVAKADYVTSSTKLHDAVLGAGGTVGFDLILGDLMPVGAVANGSIYIVLEDGSAGETLFKVDLTVTAEDTDGATTVGTPAADPLRLGVGGVNSGSDAFITDTESLKVEVTAVTNETGGGIASNKRFGFKAMFIGNATGEKGFVTDKDATQVNVLTPEAVNIGFSDVAFNGDLPVSFVQIIGVSGNGVVNNITFDFADPALTPAIGVEVEQTGTVVEWTVEDEINVKGYELVKKGTTEVVAFVEYDAANGGSYVLDLVDYDGLVDLVVVDKNGSKSNPYSPDNGNEVKGNYSLIEGWNLISVPGDNADLSEVKAATIGTFWGWDGSKYVETDAQTAYTGLWVYSDRDQIVSVTAAKADTTLTLQPGWTLAGPANTVAVPETVSVFEWNGVYTPTVSLDNGKGYWFFVTEQKDIKLDSE